MHLHMGEAVYQCPETLRVYPASFLQPLLHTRRPPCLQVHAAIRANPVAKKADRKKPAEAKRWKAVKLTYEERKANLKVGTCAAVCCGVLRALRPVVKVVLPWVWRRQWGMSGGQRRAYGRGGGLTDGQPVCWWQEPQRWCLLKQRPRAAGRETMRWHFAS